MSFLSALSGVPAPAGVRPVVVRLVRSETCRVLVKVRLSPEPEDDEDDDNDSVFDEAPDQFREEPRQIQRCIQERRVLPDEVEAALAKFNAEEARRTIPRGEWVRG